MSESLAGLRISGMTHDGRGVARYGGLAVFVEGALPDELVLVSGFVKGRAYAEAKVSKILEPSKGRSLPFCLHFGTCGGCNLQHAGYEEQLAIKSGIVLDALQRIGKLPGIQVSETLGMAEPFGYRNKAEYRIWRDLEGTARAGFTERGSHQPVEISQCRIVPNRSFYAVKALAASLNRPEWATVRSLSHAVVRVNGDGDVMLILVSPVPSDIRMQALARAMADEAPWFKSIYHCHNQSPFGDVLKGNFTLLAGQDRISFTVGGHRFEALPASFFQVNSAQAGRMYELAVEFAGPLEGKSVLDLYCGMGTISLMLARKAAKVLGVELGLGAVRDAEAAASANGINNAVFMSGLVEDIIVSNKVHTMNASVAVLDPPRAGCGKPVVDAIAASTINRVVYVSCDAATLARDAGIFSQTGFQVLKVQPIDMFPHTSHVETVCLLERQ